MSSDADRPDPEGHSQSAPIDRRSFNATVGAGAVGTALHQLLGAPVSPAQQGASGALRDDGRRTRGPPSQEGGLGARGHGGAPRADRARQPEGQRDRHAGRRAGDGRRGARPTSIARGGTLGVLHGLPVAHKDLVDTAGIRTTRGSPFYRDNVPTRDALIVTRMRAAGAITLRQDEHAGVRRRLADVQRRVRRDAESVRPDEDVRRQQRRRGRGAGLRDAADRRWQRHRRLAAQSAGVLQRRRAAPVARPRRRASPLRGRRCRLSRPDGADGRRRRALPQRDRRVRIRAARSRFEEDGGALPRAARAELQGRARRLVARPGRHSRSSRRSVASSTRNRKVFEDLGCVVEEAEPDFTGVDEAFPVAALHVATTRSMRRSSAQHPGVGQGHDQVRGRAGGARDRRGCRPRVGATGAACSTRAGSSSSVTTTSSFRSRRSQPFDVNMPYPTEIAGTTMTTYIDWMRSCWYVTLMSNPAISVPAGFTASGLPVGLQIVGRHRGRAGACCSWRTPSSRRRITGSGVRQVLDGAV